LTRSPDFYTSWLKHHLAPMCKPTNDSGNSKQNWEEIERESCGSPVSVMKQKLQVIVLTHRSIDKSTPEIDIRGQLATDEVVIFHGCVMQSHCGLKELIFASAARTIIVSASSPPMIG